VGAAAILAGDSPPDDDALLAGALATVGSVAWTEGRVGDSISFLRAAVSRAGRGGLADLAMHPRQSLTVPLVALGEFGEAEQLLAADRDEIDDAGVTGWAVGVAVWRSRLDLAAGRLSEAAADAEAGIVLADEIGARLFVPLARTTLALVALQRGDLEGAAAQLARCAAEPAQGDFIAGLCAWIEARIGYAQHDPSLAVKVLRGVSGNLPANKRALLEEPALAAWLVRSALAGEDRVTAEAVAVFAEMLSTDNPGFASIGAIASHARGLLDRDAVALARAAVDHSHGWARASAAEDLSVVLIADRDDDGAIAAVESAIAAYAHVGALYDVERAERRLAALQARPARAAAAARPLSGWGSLTVIERRVAGLVAQGLTNAQVAQRLYLSRHTIDFHLRQIFRKLEVHSRTELIRIAGENDLLR
jgi:DNA-binding CsgD family transcriptional regulator